MTSEHARHVFNFARKDANLIQRRRKRDETVTRVATVSRFQTNDAAKRSWLAHGAAGV